MEANTQKGFMLGCLSSVAIVTVIFLFLSVLMTVAMRGCSQMVVDANAEETLAESRYGERQPRDEKPFKKVWLAGHGDAKAPRVLKIRLHGIISSSLDHSFFKPSEDTSAPTALRKIRAAKKDSSIRGLYLDIDSPGGGVTMSDELYDAVLKFRESDTNRFVFVHMGDLCCSGGYYAAAPADCIRYTVDRIGDDFDLAFSGINNGINLGHDIAYSGTVGAAFEANYAGIRAISVSTVFDNIPRASEWLDAVWEFITSRDGFAHASLFNVNVPRDPRGIRFTEQGTTFYRDHFTSQGNDLYRSEYYITRDVDGAIDPDIDIDAVLTGWCSVTPLTTRRTDYGALAKLR